MGSQAAAPFDVKKVAIVGAGPAGLAAAKYLRARACFESITIFEQQDRVGGVWYYSQDPPSKLDVPQTTPFVEAETPLPPRREGEAPVFPSPMYERLHANIPGSLMNYGDQGFPGDAWVYPSRETIFEYVERYADEIRHLIRFRSQVQSIELRQVGGVDKWDLRAASTVDGEVFEDTYDAVVVANGHYSTPFIPEVAGLEAFHAAHPGVVTHSKNYRRPEAFAGQRVVVVGNGPSGLDLARQISGAGAARVFLSVHAATPADRLAHAGATEIGEIAEFLPGPSRAVRTADGRTEEAIDAVIYCTGFLFSYPFLRAGGLEGKLLTPTGGRGVSGLWEHLFLIEHPTLAFPALLMKAVPFPVAEAQAAVAAAVWSNALPLPPAEEMRAWEARLREERGGSLHTFPTHGGDGDYINSMHDWVVRQAATPGKTPPYWDTERRWQRSVFAEAKLAFEKQGGTARTLEELGFVYPGESWEAGRDA